MPTPAVFIDLQEFAELGEVMKARMFLGSSPHRHQGPLISRNVGKVGAICEKANKGCPHVVVVCDCRRTTTKEKS